MFILTKFEDLVQIPPHEFYKKSRDEIEDKINEKYSNKVVQKVGLCVCMWDVLKASDGLIGHGTGNVNVAVDFRMIVFRPFKGEIITAKVKKSTPSGIQITTEFFEDIFVPKTMLFEGCEYNDEEKAWCWKTEDSELWFDDGTTVNARVEIEKWEDAAPKGTLNSAGNAEESKQMPKRKVPYLIEASMAEPGLGGVDWW